MVPTSWRHVLHELIYIGDASVRFKTPGEEEVYDAELHEQLRSPTFRSWNAISVDECVAPSAAAAAGEERAWRRAALAVARLQLAAWESGAREGMISADFSSEQGAANTALVALGKLGRVQLLESMALPLRKKTCRESLDDIAKELLSQRPPSTSRLEMLCTPHIAKKNASGDGGRRVEGVDDLPREGDFI